MSSALEIAEKEWDAQLVGTAVNPGLARQLGWRPYHTLRSKGSQPGYPDWTLVRERVIWIESKREQGRLSESQKAWIRALHRAGAEAYVLRPSDLEDVAKVLAARNPLDTEGAAMFAAHRLLDAASREAREETAAA